MNGKIFLIISVITAASFGCATSKNASTAPGQVEPQSFEEPDLDETEGIGGYEEVVLTAEDEKLEIPGQGLGKVPPVKKKSKKSNIKDPSYWPYGPGIADLLEDLKWGMSVKKVFSIFEKKIQASYQEQINAQSGDLLAEDRIRTEMTKELNKVKNSYVRFDGQTTGYESHMVDVEFTHNNNESMLVWDAGQYVEYLFFINDRFWKRVRLFRIDKLGGISLSDFEGSMETVIGTAGQEIVNDEGELEKIVWRDDDTFVALLDGSKFFGVYGLRLSSAITETNIAKLRTNADKMDTTKVSKDVSSTINSAINSVDMDDHQESVIDQYTGQTHTDGRFGSDTKKSGNSPESKPAAKPEEKKEISNDDLNDLF
ncbi:MAG: hypothetical protein JXR91_12700 [Deltaproteobacteria bacterium]|nr:hypothetical protein [Deltaproteobacteria bacterium]